MERCVVTLANVVKQAQVLKYIIAKLNKEFGYTVYADEVKEDFRKPCFFVAATSVMRPQSVNWMRKELTVGITFYPRTQDKNEVVYMDVIDRIQSLFQVGIQVNDRHLKIDYVEDDRVGEEEDVLQVRVVISYLEQVTGERNHTTDLMEELDMDITHDGGKGHQESFPGTIGQDS